MKNIEKIAIVFILLLFLSKMVQFLGQIYMDDLIKSSPWHVFYFTLPYMAIGTGLELAIAIWMYILAKRDNNNPWIWALLGGAFSIPAVILYYVIRIHDKIKYGEPKDASNPSSPDR